MAQIIDHVVKDEVGIHARPAGKLVALVSGFESEVKLKFGEKEVDAKRLMSIMMLGMKHGDQITFTISGSDEDAANTALVQFLKENL